jgi:hypothetical protein
MSNMIMYFIFRFIIKFGVTIGTLNMLAVHFVCLVPHIHLRQTFVLKPREARAVKTDYLKADGYLIIIARGNRSKDKGI